MGDVNRKQYSFFKFETFDYDLTLEIKIRVLKQREYDESELWGLLLGICLFMDMMFEDKQLHCNWSLNSIFSKSNNLKLIHPSMIGSKLD